MDKDNPNYTTEDGVLFDKAKEKIIQNPAGKEEKCYRVPQGVATIGDRAFIETKNLHELFLPDTITKINGYVFAHCKKLTKIHLHVEDPNLIDISRFAFDKFVLDRCTLYVPIGTGYAYRHHRVFGKFKEVIIER